MISPVTQNSGWQNLKFHCFSLAIVRKTAWMKIDKKKCTEDNRSHCTWLSSQRQSLPAKWVLKWRVRYRIVHTEHDRHYCHIKDMIMECKDAVHEPPVKLRNTNTQFGRARKFINHPMNLPTITLHDTLAKEKCIYALEASFTTPPTLNLFFIGMLTRAKTWQSSVGICTISTSPESIPYMMLIYNYCAQILRQPK